MTDPRTYSQTATPSLAVDWSLAPANARWWAVDENGQAHWFCVPDIGHMSTFWFSDQIPAPSFGYSGDWRTSLVERQRTVGNSPELP